MPESESPTPLTGTRPAQWRGFVEGGARLGDMSAHFCTSRWVAIELNRVPSEIVPCGRFGPANEGLVTLSGEGRPGAVDLDSRREHPTAKFLSPARGWREKSVARRYLLTAYRIRDTHRRGRGARALSDC